MSGWTLYGDLESELLAGPTQASFFNQHKTLQIQFSIAAPVLCRQIIFWQAQIAPSNIKYVSI
jgi:hypothetical protein